MGFVKARERWKKKQSTDVPARNQSSSETHQIQHPCQQIYPPGFESDFYISRAAEIRLELKLFCIKWHIFMTHITNPGVRYGTWILILYRFHARDSFKILSFGRLLLELLRTGFSFPYLQTLDPQIEHESTSIIIRSAPPTRINRTHSFWTKTQHTRTTLNNNIAANTNDIWLTEALIDLGSYHGHQAQSPFSVPVLLFE